MNTAAGPGGRLRSHCDGFVEQGLERNPQGLGIVGNLLCRGSACSICEMIRVTLVIPNRIQAQTFRIRSGRRKNRDDGFLRQPIAGELTSYWTSGRSWKL
jgi:hypothetical protein